jgi:hypothetical protein
LIGAADDNELAINKMSLGDRDEMTQLAGGSLTIAET